MVPVPEWVKDDAYNNLFRMLTMNHSCLAVVVWTYDMTCKWMWPESPWRWLCIDWLWASPHCHYYWLTRCVQWCLQTSCMGLFSYFQNDNFAGFWRCFSEFVVSITVCWVWGQTGREKHSEHSGYIVVVTSPLSSVCQGCVKSCRSVRVWCALWEFGNVVPSCRVVQMWLFVL